MSSDEFEIGANCDKCGGAVTIREEHLRGGSITCPACGTRNEVVDENGVIAQIDAEIAALDREFDLG